MNATPPKATAFQLVFMTYAVICGGAYGLEEMVSSSGPGLSLLVLVVLPFIYAVPLSMACAELAARFPVEGGYYRWVRMSFGDGLGYTAGWLLWLAMFATNASFAVLFGAYLQDFFPNLPPLVRFAAAAAVVWGAVFLNWRGISLVGWASVVVTVLIFIPFIVLTGLGLAQWQHNPAQPFVNPDVSLAQALPGSLLVAMWLYGGFEKLTVTAGEIESPRRAFPLALAFAVPLCAASYLLPTLASLAALGDWRDWTASHFVVAATRIGGPALGAALAAGALVSNAGLLLNTILSQSRLPMVLAEDGLFPAAFGRRHPRFGSPVLSLLVTGVVITLLCGVPFTQLVGAAALVQSLAYMLIYAALLQLRSRVDDADARGFRIPFGAAGMAAMIAPSVLIILLVVEQGLFHDSRLDRPQALLDLLIIASGPISYALSRWTMRPTSGRAPA
jgi:amino acid transporter